MTKKNKTAEDYTGREFVITREFAAPRELVFKAWTDPKHLAQWWGPRGFTNPVCDWDTRPGGKIYDVMRAPNGTDYPMGGEFREIVPPARLVFACGALNEKGKMLFEFLHTATFVERKGKTTLTLNSRVLWTTAAASRYIGGFEAGMTQSLEKLAEHLTQPEHAGTNSRQKITPCLWFDDQAEEAVNFYASIFKDSKIKQIARYGDAGTKIAGKRKGTVMTILFQLEGQEFLALNGGPQFTFSPAISLIVNCKTQAEIDALWEKLSADGTGQCGWLKDKYGLSWQIVPTVVGEMMQGKDAEKSENVMKAILQMEKIDIETLRQAYGKTTNRGKNHEIKK